MNVRTRMWLYAAALMAISTAVVSVVVPSSDVTRPWALIVLSLLTLSLSNLSVELPFAVSLSLTFAPIFAGLLFAGPVGGALMGLAGAVSLREIRERKPVELMLINASQLLLAGLLAGLVYSELGGALSVAGRTHSSTVSELLAPLLAVLTFFVINLVLVGIALMLKTSVSARDALRVLNPGSYWVSLLVLALLGYVMAHLITLSSWFGLLLLVLPFTMARRTFRVFVELSEAFTETVRSLVAAIEAKDPYTRGHSERVAIYARRLGEDAGLPTQDLEILERAALLHDVGKIGISLDTLTSGDQLTAEEVREIRRHPVLGAELVEDVEFLSSLVPIIRHHHERYDGAGYPDGLVAEHIPVLSRILAVADCYDAMTSDRAYRPRLRSDVALEEMRRVAGTQLDGRFVERLVRLLDEPEGVPES